MDNFPRNELKTRLAGLAGEGVYLGGSSWKYEGWLGSVYEEGRYLTRRKVSMKRFQEHCLGEYAETFKTVGVDATFYQFPTEKLLTGWMTATPADFKFGFKVTSDITVKYFPNLPQHGVKAGRVNDHFLNADLFVQHFLEPCRAFREKVGVLMFEFSQFHKGDYAHGRDFVADLDKFLGRLPKGWNYAVEIRNRTFLHPEYFQTLARHGVAHLFNHWTLMPPVDEQLALAGSQTTDFLAARFLLSQGRTYAEAVKEFSPYSEIKAVDPRGRAAGRALIAQAKGTGRRPSFIFVNNRFEGNSPLSIAAMVEAV